MAKKKTVPKGRFVRKAKSKTKTIRIPKTYGAKQRGFKLQDGEIQWMAKGGPKLKLTYTRAGKFVPAKKKKRK